MLEATLQEFSIARASFMLTHCVDSDSFDFMAMMHEALEVDFSRVRPPPHTVGVACMQLLSLCL